MERIYGPLLSSKEVNRERERERERKSSRQLLRTLAGDPAENEQPRAVRSRFLLLLLNSSRGCQFLQDPAFSSGFGVDENFEIFDDTEFDEKSRRLAAACAMPLLEEERRVKLPWSMRQHRARECGLCDMSSRAVRNSGWFAQTRRCERIYKVSRRKQQQQQGSRAESERPEKMREQVAEAVIQTFRNHEQRESEYISIGKADDEFDN